MIMVLDGIAYLFFRPRSFCFRCMCVCVCVCDSPSHFSIICSFFFLCFSTTTTAAAAATEAVVVRRCFQELKRVYKHIEQTKKKTYIYIYIYIERERERNKQKRGFQPTQNKSLPAPMRFFLFFFFASVQQPMKSPRHECRVFHVFFASRRLRRAARLRIFSR